MLLTDKLPAKGFAVIAADEDQGGSGGPLRIIAVVTAQNSQNGLRQHRLVPIKLSFAVAAAATLIALVAVRGWPGC